MSAPKVEISASKVAGFIGVHKYQPQDEVLYELLAKDKAVQARMRAIEDAHRRRPFQQIKNRVLKDSNIQSCVQVALQKTADATTMEDILTDVSSRADVILSLRYPEYSLEVREQLISEVRGQVAKQRGTQNETAILNQYEVDEDVEVTERNTRTLRKTFDTFKLVGRTDGWVAKHNRIVDSKDRMRAMPEVPIYDEIQLRVYMNMADAVDSELVERFPDGTKRVTRFTNDPDKWDAIYRALETSVIKYNHAVEDETELKRIVFANTVQLV